MEIPNALSEAVKKGNLGAVRSLLSNNGNIHFIVQKENLLHVAASFSHTDVVKELLERGADANVSTPVSKRVPLHEACVAGNETLVKLLIPHTSDLDVGDRDDFTPVHICAMHGHLDCISALTEAGANLVMEDKNKLQPSHWAAKKNHVPILTFLFNIGVDMEAVCAQGKTPMHYAAQFGGVESLRCLVQRACDPTLTDHQHRQPIHLAAWKDNLDCLRFINGQGISFEVRQKNEKTPLHMASGSGSKACLHWLLERQVDVHAQDDKGNTALHMAAEAGLAECYNCLLYHGASDETVNHRGETPMDTARRTGHPFIIEKAAKGQILCPYCHQKKARFQWEREHPVPSVVKEMNQTAHTAYKSPLGSYESEMRQRARILKQQRMEAGSSASALSHHTKAQPGDFRSRTNMSVRPGSGTGSFVSAGTFLTQTGPGYRDLIAKYYGEHLEKLE